MAAEKIRIDKVGRLYAREGHSHDRYPFIYEAYIGHEVIKRTHISGMLWWKKHEYKKVWEWKYVGYHLSERLAKELAERLVGSREPRVTVIEYEV